MKKKNHTSSQSKINQEWPKNALEAVERCPMCQSAARTMALRDVKDWSFGCAPGSWAHFRCLDCNSIYLSERPTEASIGDAYTTYYTHAKNGAESHRLLESIIRTAVSIKQGYLNYALQANIKPSINLPVFLYRLFDKLHLSPRVFLQDIQAHQPGCMLDVGCGDGRLMRTAEKYGWRVTGLELDEIAAKQAAKDGLSIYHGSYQDIPKLKKNFDLIICSHVLEHVHNPRLFIEIMLAALAENGQIWIQWPNPESDGLDKFAENWRGLEAPRHICLPSKQSIRDFLASNYSNTVSIEDNSDHWLWSRISMLEDSEVISDARNGRVRKPKYLKAIIKYCFTSKTSIRCELNTITLRKSEVAA